MRYLPPPGKPALIFNESFLKSSPKIGCSDISLNFDYIDLTSQLCKININSNAKLLQDSLRKIYPEFNIEKYFNKFKCTFDISNSIHQSYIEQIRLIEENLRQN